MQLTALGLSKFLSWFDASHLYSKAVCAALLDHLQVFACTRPPLRAMNMIPMLGDEHRLEGIGHLAIKTLFRVIIEHVPL